MTIYANQAEIYSQHNALHKFECKMFNYEVNTGNANNKLPLIKIIKDAASKREREERL